jgi:NaMN:DMB phosphoribosyltransferase
MDQETYNPWTVVNLVFHHLADEGLHPILGESGDPGTAAAALLTALGISPVAEGNARVVQENRDLLADLRRAVLGDR